MADRKKPTAEEVLSTMREFVDENKLQALQLVHGHAHLLINEAKSFQTRTDAAEMLVLRVFQALQTGATQEEILEKVRAVNPPHDGNHR